ncbi:hypothetical protein N9A28_01085 [Sulfurimonas sp.]|nr:hypothetical protein [Sulfurimonas sp.]
MKYILILSTFLVLFTGCSHKNAFSEFKMNKEKQVSISGLQSSKIVSTKKSIGGIASAIYLNDIYPDFYNDKEYFFVYTYIKDSENLSSSDLNLQLNSIGFMDIRELPKENRFSNLVSSISDWNKYYLVSFIKDNSDDLELVLLNAKSSSVIYKRTKE